MRNLAIVVISTALLTLAFGCHTASVERDGFEPEREQIAQDMIKEKEAAAKQVVALKEALESNEQLIQGLQTESAAKGCGPEQLKAAQEQCSALEEQAATLKKIISDEQLQIEIAQMELASINTNAEPEKAEPGKKETPEEAARRQEEARKEEMRKVQKLPTELPRLVKEHQEIHTAIDDNVAALSARSQRLGELNRVLDDEQKKRDARDPSAKPMEKIEDLQKEQARLREEAETLNKDMENDRNKLRQVLLDLAEYKRLAKLVDFTMPSDINVPGVASAESTSKEIDEALNAWLRHFPVPANTNPKYVEGVKKIILHEVRARHLIERLAQAEKELADKKIWVAEAVQINKVLDDALSKEQQLQQEYAEAQDCYDRVAEQEQRFKANHPELQNSEPPRSAP